MKSSIRVSQRLLVLVFALLMHSTTCFQVRTAQQHTVATPSTSLSRRRSAAVLDNRRSCYALTVRGGATQRTGPLQALMVDTLAVVNSFYQNSPYVAAALTCGTKASAADYVAQRRQSKKDLDIASKMDTARNVAFLLYGAVYQGMAQEFIYNHLYPVWFGAGSGVGTVLKKVLFDLLVQTTLFTLPIAYLTKAAIFRHSPKQGLKNYYQDVTENGLLTKYFLLWGPVQCITFSIVPEHLRVSFIAIVSFFWLIILSSVSARPKAAAAAAAVSTRDAANVSSSQTKSQEKQLVDG